MAEIRQILCPVDLSEISRHALDHAKAIATWYEASVTVFHVHNPPPPLIPLGGMPVVPSGGVAETVQPLEHGDLVDEVRRFSATPGGTTNMHVVVVDGSPVREILRKAAQLPADLLVMSTHGRSGFEALFLGSVTEKVLRSTQVPVLTVPPPDERVQTVLYKNILCPIEFSDASTRALEYALMLAEERSARLILLHVVEQLVNVPALSEMGAINLPEIEQHLVAHARARLRSAVPDEARLWCNPDERVVSGRAHQVILDVAGQEQVELIVMGVHGKGALNRRLFGSTTHHVIREARCPVLTLRG